jgi:predicted nuclease of predicted toxin-antitoxin system
VTKDADYDDMGVVRGHPPKVLWLLIGNCTTAQIEAVLRQNHSLVEGFEQDPTMGTLCLR